MIGISDVGRTEPLGPMTLVRGSLDGRVKRALAVAFAMLAAATCPVPSASAEPSGRDGANSGPAELLGAGSSPARTIERAPLEPALLDGWSARSEPADTKREPTSAVATRAAAERALADGDVATAQRLFERIVAHDPTSPEAQEARRRLGSIYRGEILAAPAKPEAGPRPAALETTSPNVPASNEPRLPVKEADAAPVAPPAMAQPQPWRPHAKHSQRFEELLRVDVGDRIFFGLSSAEIGSRARAVVERQARWIARYPDLYIVVEGHADEPGDERDNDAMGRARAETARAMLIAAGVPGDRIDIDVRGRRDRASTCEDAVCRAQNRRVVVRLMIVLPSSPGNRSSVSGTATSPTRISDDADHQQAVVIEPPRR